MPSKKAPSFEQSLEALSNTVKQMESGDLSLEQSLKSFEQGIGLVRECQNALDQAELKVQNRRIDFDKNFTAYSRGMVV